MSYLIGIAKFKFIYYSNFWIGVAPENVITFLILYSM